MSNKAKIYLKGSSDVKWVNITTNKPSVDSELLKTWKNIVDILASVLDVSFVKITKIEEERLNNFIVSDDLDNLYSQNRYEMLVQGLYCEQTIGLNNEFYVMNALDDEKWAKNPEIEDNMISYLGLPIKWPDGEIFGALSIFHNESIILSKIHKSLLYEFNKVLEGNLKSLVQSELVEFHSYRDELTGVYNRRTIKQYMLNEFQRSRRSNETFSIMIVDLDRFRIINDTLGHEQGDTVLRFFSDILISRLRLVDIIGRWGADEFVIICPGTDLYGVQKLKDYIADSVENHCVENIPDLSCSIGLAEYNIDDENIHDMFKRADSEMYKEKNDTNLKI